MGVWRFYFEMTMSFSLGKSRLPCPFGGWGNEIMGEGPFGNTVSSIVASLKLGQIVQGEYNSFGNYHNSR